MLGNLIPHLDLTMYTAGLQTNTPILLYIVHPLLFIPTPIPPTPDSTMLDLDGMEEQPLLKRAMPTTIIPNIVDCGKSCPINGGKRYARGGQTWTVDMIIRMMEDKLGVRIRSSSCTVYTYTRL